MHFYGTFVFSDVFLTKPSTKAGLINKKNKELLYQCMLALLHISLPRAGGLLECEACLSRIKEQLHVTKTVTHMYIDYLQILFN